jgi:hypothetical protein
MSEADVRGVGTTDAAGPPEPPASAPAAASLPAALAGARMPADLGISGLGLLMQLGGSLFAALTAVVGFLQLINLSTYARFGAGTQMLAVLAVAVIGVVRSAQHRSAGVALLYPGAAGGDDPRRALRRYLAISAAHTASWLGFLVWNDVDASTTISVVLAFAAWPAILAVALHRGPLRHLAGPAPVAEDKGFEGAAVLMVLFGLCGALFTALLIAGVVSLDSAVSSSGPGVFFLVMLVLLLLRSGLHVHAGWRGLHETHIDRAVEATNRYADFAVIVSFVASGILLVIMMMEQAGVQGVLFISGLAWLLLLWPLALRRFFGERQFADLLAGEAAPVHRRSPDRGLTALGWLLLALGAINLAFSLPSALLPTDDAAGVLASVLGAEATHSPWWDVGVAALQVWAGVELVRMSDQHRVAATVYGVVSAATSIYLALPILRRLDEVGSSAFSATGLESLGVAVLAISLVLPLAAVLLTSRAFVPAARARFRAKR